MIPSTDQQWMQLALLEAKKGSGRTAPNPIVGAVIVQQGTLIARGYHTAAGHPHAEVEALRALATPEQAAGATIYVTLEPCSTTGKTPPCTTAIIEAGLTRVVYGATDPNPHHQGRAQQLLEQAGISVTTGVLAKQCTALNAHWNYRMRTGVPWVIAKCGRSLDGRIASPPDRRWITSPASRHDAMRLRAKVDAILVGGATIRTDNPSLTIRGLRQPKQSLQPWRVVWTHTGNIPSTATILTDAHRDRTLIITGKSLEGTLRELAERGISSVLIEGGGQTLGAAFDQGLVNEVRFYVAPLLLGGPTPAVGGKGFSFPEGAKVHKISYRTIGDDLVISGLVEKLNRD